MAFMGDGLLGDGRWAMQLWICPAGHQEWSEKRRHVRCRQCRAQMKLAEQDPRGGR